MATRIRTLNFLPDIFRTPTNSQFLRATLDQLVGQPNLKKIEGYVGSKFGYGIDAGKKYVVEPNKTRNDYQLEPGVAFLKTNATTAKDFMSYPGILDAIKLQGGISDNNDRLFNSQFYSWDSFTDLDKLINFNQYYWVPSGLPAVTVATTSVYESVAYAVANSYSGYSIQPEGTAQVQSNSTITLLRGGVYTFSVNQTSQFWIQGEPGITGASATQPNVQTREVLGVENNGASTGLVTFTVPAKDAQDGYNLPGNHFVDLVTSVPFALMNNAPISSIDGVTSLNGKTLMFYNTGVPAEIDNASNLVSQHIYTITTYDVSGEQYISISSSGSIIDNEKITVRSGDQWINRNFYRSTPGFITLVPYISASLDTLYYQDGTDGNKVGMIKLIESNALNYLNVETDIVGKKQYTSPNGVTFTNGLKVIFTSDVLPSSYEAGEYYVEGVGTAIQLLLVSNLLAAEVADNGEYVPFDSIGYDMTNYDSSLYVPVNQDYITIARNSTDLNAWSRSNRWFHRDVIKATAEYNNSPSVLGVYSDKFKAKRPIVEFRPNLRLHNSGIYGKAPVDFIDFNATSAFTEVEGKTFYMPDTDVSTTATGSIVGVVAPTLTTTVSVPAADVIGQFAIGQYVMDSDNLLPPNARITNITGTTTIVLTLEWTKDNYGVIPNTSGLKLFATNYNSTSYSVFDGARIVFAADSNPDIRDNIYTVRFSTISPGNSVITLSQSYDSPVVESETTVVYRGAKYAGRNFYYSGQAWIPAQQKTKVNQAPRFDIFDSEGISLSDPAYYTSTSFAGSTLFQYGVGTGKIDPILGFPIRYSSVDNLGDISFDVTLNSGVFNYVRGTTPIEQNVNTGYVHSFSDTGVITRNLGWQTAIQYSVQRQLFEFDYTAGGSNVFVCDVAAKSSTESAWPTVTVFVNNTLLDNNEFSVSVGTDATTVTVTMPNPALSTKVQIKVLSDQISDVAFYEIPDNLNNNPLNDELITANVGDIRRHYQSICNNAPGITGDILGANNFRDSGDLTAYGNSIIQNSASLVAPAAFLRKQNHSLFDALKFNSKEYVAFKTLLIHTINDTAYAVYPNAADMLDAAMDAITQPKTDIDPFFWSDMLPTKSAYISNTYKFANSLDSGTFPVRKVYDFTSANYDGIVVYLTRTDTGVPVTTQLINGIDYVISQTTPSVSVKKALVPGDAVEIREFNQTYGSYVPNTPTKMGLYPATVPSIIIDSGYATPTYFIIGHDGSYSKLFGEYDPVTGLLSDFRDQVIYEFELRVYNNLKINNVIPVNESDVMPGFFRDTLFSEAEIARIYSSGFLNWAGSNRINYKTQYFDVNDDFTFNYTQSENKLDGSVITQGHWRGLYNYMYDTFSPDTAPWEMLGVNSKPQWFDDRYGVAPYTSENQVLWDDLEKGINWNNGLPFVVSSAVRPGLSSVIPVDTAGNLRSPMVNVVGNYINQTLQNNWKVGDIGPAELSYRRSSSWPFDLMRIFALTQPAQFFNLAIDVDNYKYYPEFDQYLVNERSHLVLKNVEVYGTGTAKTSYLNWIVDYEKQIGVPATEDIRSLLTNIDVRLVYRLAGFSDKNLMKFYVEKNNAASKNNTLLIPDESYSILLYDNQPFSKVIYSSVVVQITAAGFSVFGNSQSSAYFTVNKPVNDGKFDAITVEQVTVQLPRTYSSDIEYVPYGTEFKTIQDVSKFIYSYGKYLESLGCVYDDTSNGIPINWSQMIAEFMYWAQTGWETGSIINLNPAAETLTINKESNVVQPLTIRQQNFVLNQNLYPITSSDTAVVREGTKFSVTALAEGDTIGYGEFNLSNFEHGVVFDNVTVFGDRIYNLVTGLRQNRILLRGSKTAEWDGTIDTQGFILNQDNVQEWNKSQKYGAGTIVTYKNKYWIATKAVQASEIFVESNWTVSDYDTVQKGLLPNPSTRSYESTIYYDSNRSSLIPDSGLLGFSLIGYRPRDYLSNSDMTQITQINIFKNLIKGKGTSLAANVFKGATLAQGGIDYDIYENWSIKTAEFGGVMNNNFVEFRLNEGDLTSNPAIVGLTSGMYVSGVQQHVPLYALYNYLRPVSDPNILSTVSSSDYRSVLPNAGYVNFNDVKMSSYYFSSLLNNTVPLSKLHVGDYVWLADYTGTWQVLTPVVFSNLSSVVNNSDGTATFKFDTKHNLTQYQSIAVVNFDARVDGYFTVLKVVSPAAVQVRLDLSNSVKTLTGTGTGFVFISSRVDQPSKIAQLPLLNTAFAKNTVWVDSSVDGGWAVYRKNINYAASGTLTDTGSSSLGTAVAFSTDMGYLVGDAAAGKIHRYQYNDLYRTYLLAQTINGDPSFGSTIVHQKDIFVVAAPEASTAYVTVYKLSSTSLINSVEEVQVIEAPVSSYYGGYIGYGDAQWGTALALSGDTNWLYISSMVDSSVHAYHKSALTGLYESVYIITCGSLGLLPEDRFGHALATDYYGENLFVSAIHQNAIDDNSIDNYGYTYAFNRTAQTIETQFSSIPNTPQTFNLVWAPVTYATIATATTSGTNVITCADTTNFIADMPVIFTSVISTSGLTQNKVYYIKTIPTSGQITVSSTRGGPAVVLNTTSGLMDLVAQTAVQVEVNGILLPDNNYAFEGSKLIVTSALRAGDLIKVSGSTFALEQVLSTESTARTGVQFGTSIDTNPHASELLVGAPYFLNPSRKEGAVFRFTNAGAKYGMVIGSDICNLTVPATILINGYMVELPAGDATAIATTINVANVTNVTAAAQSGKIVISLIDSSIAETGSRLTINVVDIDVLTELGIKLYTKTQTIEDLHTQQTTQFGKVVKLNETGSFVVSAPSAIRYINTTFDLIDDASTDNDLLFDNGSTTWVDSYKNAGAVYMYDYLANSNESLANPGKYVYAQSLNDVTAPFVSQPYYGTSLDFNGNHVVIGTPNEATNTTRGQINAYSNQSKQPDWSIYRKSSPVVDVSKIQDIQLFSASTNKNIDNLDYIDPLAGKLLGVVMENLDAISNTDPAGYTTTDTNSGSIVWGADKVGSMWFNTANARFVNYHQDDVVYDSQYWGTVFPGSDVAVYTWVSSTVAPSNYAGPGTPLNATSFTRHLERGASDQLTAVYYFWARNTQKVFTNYGKTLADSIIEDYIREPIKSGISFFTALRSDSFAIYNSTDNVNNRDTVLHVGFSSSTSEDVPHNLHNLIRAGYADDFLPGLPTVSDRVPPNSLYLKLLDSLAGDDNSGAIVPNPYLPKAVQYGIQTRPNQSFFIDRYSALKNYFTYANATLSQFPIAETKKPTMLFATSEFYDTTQYWEYIDWWAPGYSNTTKSVMQVPLYSDLAAVSASNGLIVTVELNGAGQSETYLYTDGVWVRIGLQNGTIQFKKALWDYASTRTGFGDNFFDATLFSEFPSVETRNIVRSLNEEIFTSELVIHRNRSLVLLFEFIQSETNEISNYLPWLNKTSFVDVGHTIRELRPIEVYRADNQEFLTGYLNEVKPYHVVIKEFLFKYTGQDTYEGDITDFDVPAQYNSTYSKYISPQLVYSEPTNETEFSLNDPVWQEAGYKAWSANNGLRLGGVSNYDMTRLASYITLNSASIHLANHYGFPSSGEIKIDNEEISYTSIDDNLGLLGGLTRGINGTPVTTHTPGASVYLNLAPVVLLDGGRGYANPPVVEAWIDTSKFPMPRRPAILTAVMQADKLLRVDVVDAGDGYYTTPEIRITPANTVSFNSNEVAVDTDSIRIHNTSSILTGDIIKYYVSENSEQIGGLSVNQYYYVGVLEVSPYTVIALYTSVRDAVTDRDRVKFLSAGSGNNYLQFGAVATCITTANPVRENITTIRFDRIAYSSAVREWKPGSFYSAYYAGLYNNSAKVASSSIQLKATTPPISTVLASAAGTAFALLDVDPIDNISWSSSSRFLVSTSAPNIVEVKPNTPGAADYGTVNPTLGFYVDMPVHFSGPLIGGIVLDTVYYVVEVIDGTRFTMSETIGGVPVTLTNGTVSSVDVVCHLGSRNTGALITFDYPGISTATATDSNTNYITVPFTGTAQDGTTNYYTGLPITFNGTVTKAGTLIVGNSYKILTVGTSDFVSFGAAANIPGTTFVATNEGSGTGTTTSLFGGLIENEKYYVTTVIDTQHFTVSTEQIPAMIDILRTEHIYTAYALSSSAGTNIVHCDGVTGFKQGQTIVFASNLGGLVAGTTYYILSVDTVNDDITLSATYDGPPVTLSNQTATVAIKVNNAIICNSTLNIAVNDPVVFTFMTIDDIGVTNFGGLIAGVRYFVTEKYSGGTAFAVSTTLSGHNVILSETNAMNPVETRCLLTNQKNVTKVITGKGSMTVTAGLPISPGQVDGQLFTMYESGADMIGKTGTNGDLLNRRIESAIGTISAVNVVAVEVLTNYITLSHMTSIIGVNSQITLTGTAISNLVAGTYYVKSFPDILDPTKITLSATAPSGIAGPEFAISSSATGSMVVKTGNQLSIDPTSGIAADFYTNMPITVDTSYAGLVAGTTYYVRDKGQVTTTVTAVSGDTLTCVSTAGFYVGMRIVFTGAVMSGLEYGTTYYVNEIVSATSFKIATENSTPASIQSRQISTLIPSYVYASTDWDIYASTADTTPTISILNPNSGPGVIGDAAHYGPIVTSFQATAMGKVYGYVSTDYGSRAIASVKLDIDNYLAWYPTIDGFFLDELEPTTSDLAYYTSIRVYVDAKPGTLGIIGNGGINTIVEDYVAVPTVGVPPIVDTLVMFEGDAATFAAVTMPAWVDKYPAENFAWLVYGATKAQSLGIITRAKYENVQYVFTTDDVLANPWNAVPTYWTDETAAMVPTTTVTSTYLVRYIRDRMNGSTANASSYWLEIQAYDRDGVNVALGKPATSSSAVYGGTLAQITDGVTTSTPADWVDLSDAYATVIVDLGDTYDITSVKRWHYYADGRTFHGTKTEVSADGVNWTTIFDSAVSGEYAETIAGKEDFVRIPSAPISGLPSSTGDMEATGAEFVRVATVAGGTVKSLSTTLNWSPTGDLSTVKSIQLPVGVPTFDVTYELGGYRALITFGAAGYAVNNTITMPGATLGGTTPVNDLLLRVTEIDSLGKILGVQCNGTPNEIIAHYYFKVVSDTKAELYYDARLTLPVDGYHVKAQFPGIVTGVATATTAGTNEITVNDSSLFNVNDEVIFTGFTEGTFGNIVAGEGYYVLTSAANKLTVSEFPGSSVFVLTNFSGSCVIAHPGTYMLLPEPFYFSQSLVSFNRGVYECLISNNDEEFIFGKWQLLRSDSRKLNALDRIMGYYTPTDNMPGVDLTQLVDGIIYPNNIYLGNAFAPEYQWPLDTVLVDPAFVDTNIEIMSVVWNGTSYVAPANNLSESDILISADGKSWDVSVLAGAPLAATDIVYAEGRYVVTTENIATPILTSTDAIVWSVIEAIPATSLSSAAHGDIYGNGVFVAVGKNIITSNDGVTWTETHKFYSNALVQNLYSVKYTVLVGYEGFIAVGKGQKYVTTPEGLTVPEDISLVFTSPTGLVWSPVGEYAIPSVANVGLNAIAADGQLAIAVGNEGTAIISYNGVTWDLLSTGITENLRDIVYANGQFVAVGDYGTIITSLNGNIWTVEVSGTDERLNSVMYNEDTSEYLIVAKSLTLSSTDGVVWTSSSIFIVDAPIHTITGDSFIAGYGPEELVPGVVSDNLTMIVSTRPGTNWPVTKYQHTGYSVVSGEVTPT